MKYDHEMLGKLESLYPGKADNVYKELQIIIKEFKQNFSPKENQKDFFTEKDVMLICYADHVKEQNIKTFKTMHKFLKKYAKGHINKVHFLPFYPYSSDEGFSVIDYYKVDEPFGSWTDVKEINKDFGFMFDLVVNHISVKSDWFKKFLEGDEYYKDFFITFDEEIDTSKVFRPRTSPLLTPFETKKGKKYVWTTFSEDQADLNYSNPKVLLEVIKIILFYVKNGAQAIRLDAIAYAWKTLGTSCFGLPQSHTLVKLLRDIFNEAAPNVWIITETVIPHKENMKFFGDGHDEAHLVYNFVIETLLLAAIFKKDSTTATKWLNSFDSPSKDTSFLNLTVSHDGIHTLPAKGIVSEEDMNIIAKESEKKGGKVLYRTVPGKDPEPYEFNITYFSAVGGVDAFLATQAIQLSLKGVPLIYLNNLIGAENWDEGFKTAGYGRALNRERFDYEKLVTELETSGNVKNQVYTGFKRLLDARINEPLFSPLAKAKALEFDTKLMAILRSKDDKKLLSLVNISDEQVDIDSAKIIEALGKTKIKDILSKEEIKLEGNLSLKPYQILWLK